MFFTFFRVIFNYEKIIYLHYFPNDVKLINFEITKCKKKKKKRPLSSLHPTKLLLFKF